MDREVDRQPPALAAIRAWVRLDRAFAEFNRHLGATLGITGAQLALLRLIDEGGVTTLAELRGRLFMHPATLGQLVERLQQRGLVALEPDPEDRRRRRVELTREGRETLVTAPLAGPVRLRSAEADQARLRRLAAALEDAVDLFGLERWAP